MTRDRGIFSSCCSDPEEDFLYVLAYHISCIISSSFPQQFNFLWAYSVCEWLIFCVLQWQDFLYSEVALRLKKQKTLLEGKNVISSFTPFVFHRHVFLSVLLMVFSSLRLSSNESVAKTFLGSAKKPSQCSLHFDARHLSLTILATELHSEDSAFSWFCQRRAY